MSTQQKRSELLTFGYIKTAYKDCIPVQLIKLTQLFYDDWNYWLLKGAKLKQFVNSKAYEKITCTKSFVIKGIEFEMFSNPNGISSTHELDGISTIGVEIKYLPTNIKSFAFYTEIKCEALNHTLKKFVHISPSNKIYGEVMCQLSELKHMKTVCFDHVINIKYIKYKKDCNKIDYFCPINKIQKCSKLTWNINGLLLQKCKKMSFRQAAYSNNFDNNNWCLILHPNGASKKGKSELYLQCLHFPHNVKSMDIKSRLDIHGEFETQEATTNFTHDTTAIGGTLTSFSEFKLIKESFSFSVTLEIMHIYDTNDEIIDQTHWEKLGIKCVL